LRISCHKKALSLALVWWGLILASLPIGRAITNYLREHFLLNLVLILTITLLLILVLGGLFWLHRQQKISDLKVRAILFLFLSWVLGALLLERPEERWHIYHYGILAVLLWESFSGRRWQRTALCAVLVVSCGFLEESAQLFIPQRVFDWRDVLLNGGSGIWGVFVLSLQDKNQEMSERGLDS
tara:strand:+ start:309 stop:857 length:549 start_codon:yes stop_codon:yes gene_type:complete